MAVVEAVTGALGARDDAAGDEPDPLERASSAAAGKLKVETLAFHADATRQFSQSAGLSKYVWTTQLDEKVRPGHAALEGSIQLWAERPVTDAYTDRHAHPGEDANCRCIAFPWDDGEEALEPAPPRPIPPVVRRPAPPPPAPAPAPPPAPIPDLSSFAATVQSSAPREVSQLVARALDRAAAAPERLRAAGLAPMAGFELRVGPVSADANGLYLPRDLVVKAGAPQQAELNAGHYPKESPRSWSTAYITKDPAESAALTAVHEFGHHVHYELRKAAYRPGAEAKFMRAERRIQEAYREAVPDATRHLPSADESARLATADAGRAPSRYGRFNYEEFWSESFAMYHHDRQWLERERPIAFAMARDVLQLLGLQT